MMVFLKRAPLFFYLFFFLLEFKLVLSGSTVIYFGEVLYYMYILEEHCSHIAVKVFFKIDETIQILETS